MNWRNCTIWTLMKKNELRGFGERNCLSFSNFLLKILRFYQWRFTWKISNCLNEVSFWDLENRVENRYRDEVRKYPKTFVTFSHKSKEEVYEKVLESRKHCNSTTFFYNATYVLIYRRRHSRHRWNHSYGTSNWNRPWFWYPCFASRTRKYSHK